MQLRDYIKELGHKEFARKLGISLSYAYALTARPGAANFRTPGRRLARDIEKISNGKVRAVDPYRQ